MAIKKLAEEVHRIIGASQVLSDPSIVIKELIDNALDARATSVAIEISNNTLDIIHVRDNGHGVSPDDRLLVARSNTTSKLLDIADLKSLGGTSLGFRGQTLAAAAEMSGTLTIITRVEGEPVAVALSIDQHGEVIGQERASLPVGTTVKITDFLKAQPVRRQYSLRNEEKCLKNIKQILQSYAFARPHVRFSLRVLKAKNEKSNWMYAPKVGGPVEDAATKIVGVACASQCTWSVLEEKGYEMQAFLPRIDADPHKISNIGAFVSVDGRPVSAVRGTFKQLVKIFRDSLKRSNPAFDSVKEPFIYLSLQCPSASYDVNVEPAKDDLLFEDPEAVMAIARRLFAAVYTTRPALPKSQLLIESRHDVGPSESAAVGTLYSAADDFTTSLEQPIEDPVRDGPVPPFLTPTSVRDSGTTSQENGKDLGEPHRVGRALDSRTFRSTMYGMDDDDLVAPDALAPSGHDEAEFDDSRETRHNINLNNPWIIAKMNTSLRVPPPMENDSSSSPHESQQRTPSMSPIKRRQAALSDHKLQHLPTPQPSSPWPSEGRRGVFDQIPVIETARESHDIELWPHSFSDRVRETVINPVLQVSPQQPQDAPQFVDRSPLQSSPPNGTPLSAIPNRSPHRARRPQLNRTYVMPRHDQPQKEKVWFDHLEEAAQRNFRRKRPCRATNSDGLVQQGELDDLSDECRPLTPPRHNRDIREFMGVVDANNGGLRTFITEGRQFVQSEQISVSSPSATAPLQSAHGQGVPAQGVIYSGDSVPASEIAAISAQVRGSLAADIRPATYQSMEEPRVLRQISCNGRIPSVVDGSGPDKQSKGRETSGSRAAIGADVDENHVVASDGDREYQRKGKGRSASNRQPSTEAGAGKRRRTNTARLPLERIPASQRTHNLACAMANSASNPTHFMTRMDGQLSLLKYNEPAINTVSCFATLPDAGEMKALTTKLQHLLLARVSDGEMVQDLGLLVQNMFRAHGEEGHAVEMLLAD